VAKCINNIAYDLKTYLKSNTKIFDTWAIAVDESKYVNNSAQLALFIHGCNSDLLVTDFWN